MTAQARRTLLVAAALLVAVTAGAAGDECHHGGDSVDIVSHVANGPCLEIPLLPFLGVIKLPPYLSKVSVWLMISAAVLIGLFALARRGMDVVPKKGLYNLLESLVVFVRDEIAVKNIGEHHARAYTPYLLTVFFFILTCNLIGLVPGGVTVTGNINITATLALFTLVLMQASGIREHGLVGHFRNLVPHGVPVWLLPLMAVVEVMGVLAKPFALAIRLYANMTAGHVVIASLLGLIFSFGTLLIAPVSVGFALFIFVLELLVAFLQAYIFTMLTALFISMSVHSH
jgi:F-type H+-transporting ATPase subunit a